MVSFLLPATVPFAIKYHFVNAPLCSTVVRIPVGNLVIFVCHQGFNTVTAVVQVAFGGLVLPSDLFLQDAELGDGLGQIGSDMKCTPAHPPPLRDAP